MNESLADLQPAPDVPAQPDDTNEPRAKNLSQDPAHRRIGEAMLEAARRLATDPKLRAEIQKLVV